MVNRNGDSANSSNAAKASPTSSSSNSNAKPIIYLSSSSSSSASGPREVLNKIPSVAQSAAAVNSFTTHLLNSPLFKSIPNPHHVIAAANTQASSNLSVRSKSPSVDQLGTTQQQQQQQQQSLVSSSNVSAGSLTDRPDTGHSTLSLSLSRPSPTTWSYSSNRPKSPPLPHSTRSACSSWPRIPPPLVSWPPTVC